MTLARLYRTVLAGLVSVAACAVHAQSISATIPAGSEPIAVAVNPVTNKVYVANWSSGNVTVINGATGTATNVATGTRPTWVAVNPETGYAYVGNATTGTTTVIDGTSDAVVKQINVVVPGPFTINVHGDRIYQNREGTADETNIIALSTNSYIHTAAILSYAPSALVFDMVANRLHVSTLASSDVVNMDMTGDPEYATSRYCPDYNGGMRPIDPTNHNPPTCSDVPGAPVHIAVNPLTGRVYSISNTGEISVIQKPFYDFTVLHPEGSGSPFTGAAAIAVNPLTNKVYAAYANAIVVVDGATNAMTVLPGGGVGIGINVLTNRIYVPSANGVLTVINGDTNAVTTLAIPSGAKGIAVNPLTNKAYVVADQVTVIDGNAGDATRANALAASITPLAGNASGPSGSIRVTASSSMAAAPLDVVRGIYYQLGTSPNAPWQRIAGPGPYDIPYANLAPGAYTLRVAAANGLEAPNINTDVASVPITGNVVSYTFNVSPPQAGAVSLSSSSAASGYGQAITFTASVSGGTGTATGTIAFRDGPYTLAGCGAVALANGSASCTTSLLAPGTHAIVAAYGGSSTYGAGTSNTVTVNVSGATGPVNRSRIDFNGDGSADVLWQHADGSSALWLVNGLQQSGGARLLSAGSGWTAKLVGDFDGNGRADIVWTHADGSSAVWLMDGTRQIGGARLLSGGSGWSPVFLGDFNGDGRADIVWKHTDGSVALWLMNGGTQVGGARLLTANPGWFPKALADLNGDGRADVLWEHPDGSTALWLMNGTSQVGGARLTNPGSTSRVQLTADFNGDGRADIAWTNGDGSARIALMNGASEIGGATVITAGSGWSIAGAGDVNGDGKADLVVRHADGRIAAWLMDGGTVVAEAALTNAGSGLTVKRVADFHPDGKAEVLVQSADGVVSVISIGTNGVAMTPFLPNPSGWSAVPLAD